MGIIDKTDLSRGLNFEADVMTALVDGNHQTNVIGLGVTDDPEACLHGVLKARKQNGEPATDGRLFLVHECRDLDVIRAELTSLAYRLNRLLQQTSTYRIDVVDCCPPKPGRPIYYIFAWIA